MASVRTRSEASYKGKSFTAPCLEGVSKVSFISARSCYLRSALGRVTPVPTSMAGRFLSTKRTISGTKVPSGMSSGCSASQLV